MSCEPTEQAMSREEEKFKRAKQTTLIKWKDIQRANSKKESAAYVNRAIRRRCGFCFEYKPAVECIACPCGDIEDTVSFCYKTISYFAALVYAIYGHEGDDKRACDEARLELDAAITRLIEAIEQWNYQAEPPDFDFTLPKVCRA